MANFIQKFENQSAYDAAEHQYPNTSLVGTDIVFAMAAPAFGGLTVKYNIEDPTQEVTLFNGGGGSSTSSSTSGSGSGSGGALPTRMIVDGVEETPINTWRFDTLGEHIVQYEFENNIINVAFDNIIEITEIVIGDDITQIPTLHTNGVFFNCVSLTTVTIGNGVTSIGDRAFFSCLKLTSITIGSGVTSIGRSAFESCRGLSSVTIPDSVTSIGNSAFDNCGSLTSVTIGSGITTIGDSAFADSNLSLASVTVNATTPPVLGDSAFYGSALNFTIYVPSASVNAYKEASGWSDFSPIQPIS